MKSKSWIYIAALFLGLGIFKAMLVFLGPKLTHDPEPADIPILIGSIFAIIGVMVLFIWKFTHNDENTNPD